MKTPDLLAQLDAIVEYKGECYKVAKDFDCDICPLSNATPINGSRCQARGSLTDIKELAKERAEELRKLQWLKNL